MATLDPRRLETSRAVALHGRVSEAARHLNLSQPAVSAQILQLEQALGCALFLRSRSGIQLTPEGQRLMETAEAMHRMLGEAEQWFQRSSLPLGPLRLGASTTSASYILPPILAAFLKAHPGTPLHLEVGNTQQVQDWLRSGKIDLGMVEGLPRTPGLRMEPYRDEELVCVAPTKPPKHLLLPASATDLGQTTLLWREPGSGTRAVVAKALAALSPPRHPRPDEPVLGQTETLKAAIQAGLGIGFLPVCAFQGELSRKELQVLELPGLKIHRTFSWVIPPGGCVGSAAELKKQADHHL